MRQTAQILQPDFQKPKIRSGGLEKLSSRGLENLPDHEIELVKEITVLATSFPNLGLTPDRVLEICEALSDLAPDQISRGIRGITLAKKEMYPGTNVIAQIRGYALGHDKQTTAGEAWGEVVEEIKKPKWARNTETGCWYRKPPVFSSELIEKTVKIMGGISSLENSTNPIADRAHFTEIYEGLLEKKNISEMLGE